MGGASAECSSRKLGDTVNSPEKRSGRSMAACSAEMVPERKMVMGRMLSTLLEAIVSPLRLAPMELATKAHCPSMTSSEKSASCSAHV